MTINRHKIKRRLNRTIANARHGSFGDRQNSFGRGGANPYRRSDQNKTSIKKKIEYMVLALSLGGFFGAVFFHPFFQISNIQVNGLERINRDDFVDSVESILNYKKLFFLPGKSYPLVDVGEMQEIFLEKFPVRHVSVEKTFPDTLIINVEEKISTVIYDNGEKYSYLGLDGKVVELLKNVEESEWEIEKEITTTTLADGTIRTEERIVSNIHKPNFLVINNEFGDYPIVFDKSKKQNEVGKEVLTEKNVESIIYWFDNLKLKTDINFRHAEIDEEGRELTIYTDEGWYIILSVVDSSVAQFDKFMALLHSNDFDTNNVNYIDLRFADRVYWQ